MVKERKRRTEDMNEKEEGHETDIKGKIKYKQNRVVSGHHPHKLIKLEMQKYLKTKEDDEEEEDE
jgi:hypothetical protein